MKLLCLLLILAIHSASVLGQTESRATKASDTTAGLSQAEERVTTQPSSRTSFVLAAESWSSLHAGYLAIAESPDVPTYSFPTIPDGADGGTTTNVVIHKNEWRQSDKTIRWTPAMNEALLSTGIMHAFNLGTEAGTRDALNGPWLKDYLRSVGELRGWSDSDHFMAPYVGHPIQGSIFGFILRQNDPKYRNVQWGDGRDYFISLLRSMAFSAVWHTQWKIGPASEASIGNVMLHASPGFITLVDTPTLGAVTMIAEDAADRYIIIGLENRTTSRALIILARCFLNPGRSFANVVAFKRPWNRDTRIGLFGESYLVRKQLLAAYKDGSGGKPFEFVRRPPVENGSDSGGIILKKRPSS